MGELSKFKPIDSAEEELARFIGVSLEEVESAVEYDSLGNPLTKEQSEFFRNSKIRDSQGRLLVCYHGSNENFEVFDKEKRNKGDSLGLGFYFSSEEGISKQYSENVKKFYLNIKNPRFYEKNNIKQWFLMEVAREYGLMDRSMVGVNLNTLVTGLLQEDGYDGVMAHSNIEESFEIVAYEPNQIKLVTNQKPTSGKNINK